MNLKLRKLFLPLFGFTGLFQLATSILNISQSKLPFAQYLGFASSVFWGINILIAITIIILERKIMGKFAILQATVMTLLCSIIGLSNEFMHTIDQRFTFIPNLTPFLFWGWLISMICIVVVDILEKRIKQ